MKEWCGTAVYEKQGKGGITLALPFESPALTLKATADKPQPSPCGADGKAYRTLPISINCE